MVFGALTCTYNIIRWSLFDQELEILGSSWAAGARLLVAALTLSWIGHSLCSVLWQRWSPLRCLAFQTLSPVAGLIVALTIGESACLVWVHIRSGISGLLYALSGYQAPITLAEVVILIGSLFLVNRKLRKSSSADTTQRSTGRYRHIVIFLGLLAIALLPIALRELPREISLSSDPDQHSFWASQVLRLGGIPWDQGILGVGSFGYPAGFAALNAVWCLFSGLSPIECVVIQPMLQFVLAALLCAVAAEHCMRHTVAVAYPPQDRWVVFISLLLLALYWTVLPYGYQISMYHGEGGGRASTALFMAIILVGIIVVGETRMSTAARQLCFASMGISGALVATINPVSAIAPFILVGFVGLGELARSLWALRRRETRAVGILTLVVTSAVCLGLIVCDPYFTEKLGPVFAHLAEGNTATVTAQPPINPFAVTLPPEPFIPWIMPSRLSAFLFGGVFPPEFFTVQLYVLTAALALWWLTTAPWAAIRFWVVLITLSTMFYFSLGIPRAGDAANPVYLIQPYIMQSIMQMGCVLGFLLLAIGALSITRCARGWGSVLVVAAIAICTVTTDASLVTYNRFFNIKPRRANCGSLGCVTAGDRAAIEFVRTLGTDLIARYPGLSYEEMPKIMLPTHPADLGTEEWLFPSGASRILPLESTLPVAFFYGRGSPHWTFDNYRRHVCSQFDLAWLRRRNVRFLFLPAHNPGCIRGLSRIVSESTVLFEREGTKVLQLF